MSDPLSDECLYCGSSYVLDDAWFCDRHECWAAYEREGAAELWRETHRPLTHNKARADLAATKASVWGVPYLAMERAIERLMSWT